MYGLCGAHRTGKTTLAREYAKRVGIQFVQTGASQVFRDMGLNPADDHPLSVRLDVQQRILSHHEGVWGSEKLEFITDRTPIDFMAYTLADVRQADLTPELDERLQKYMKDCINATNRFFSVLIVVQPGIKVVEEAGKASLAKSHIDHISNLVLGLTVDERNQSKHYYIPKSMTDLSKRLENLELAFKRATDSHKRFIDNAKESGSPVVFH